MFHETFDGVTAPSLPAGWTFDAHFSTSSTPGGSIVPTSSPNVLAILSPGINTQFFAIYDTPDTNSGNVTVTCNFNAVATSANQTFGLIARGSASSITSTSGTYYWLQFSTNGLVFRLDKTVSGVQSVLTTVTLGAAPTIPDWYQAVFVLNGSSSTVITATLQRLADGYWLDSTGAFQPSPTTAISYTDSSSPITGAGYAGLTIQSRSDDAYADDWIIDNAPSPPPPPPPKSAPLYLPGPWTPPESFVAFIPALPYPAPFPRWLAPFPPAVRLAPFEDIPPRVAIPPALASPGTPAPIAVGPPGSPRVLHGVADEGTPRIFPPPGLPSAGTPSHPTIMPPGAPRAIAGIAEDILPRAWMPAGLPSVGTPGSTGPGLLVPPGRISLSWAAGGTMGGGGLAGGVGGENASGWSGDNGLAPWGAGSPTTDGAPFLLGGWASNGPGSSFGIGGGEAGVAPIPPGGNAGGSFALGSIGCCCECQCKVCVTACGEAVDGATVDILLHGSIVASKVTDASGCATFNLSGTFEVRVTWLGSVLYDVTQSLPCNGTIGVAVPNTGFVCCGTVPNRFAIPENLTLTSGLGTTSFVYTFNVLNPISGWYGQFLYDPGGDIVIDWCSSFFINQLYVALGPGTVVVSYFGFCSDGGLFGYPPGQFIVMVRWLTWPYFPNNPLGPTECFFPNPPTRLWYPPCNGPLGNANGCTCTYAASGSNPDKFGEFYPWDAYAIGAAPPTSTSPFMWSAPITAQFNPCVIPEGALDVTVSQ